MTIKQQTNKKVDNDDNKKDIKMTTCQLSKFQDNDADTNGKSIKDIEEEKKAEKEKQQKYENHQTTL